MCSQVNDMAIIRVSIELHTSLHIFFLPSLVNVKDVIGVYENNPSSCFLMVTEFSYLYSHKCFSWVNTEWRRNACQHAARHQRCSAPSRLLAAKTDPAPSAPPRSWEDLCRGVSCKGDPSTHSSSFYLHGAAQNDVDRAINTRENNTVIVSKDRLCYFDQSSSFVTSLGSGRRQTTPVTTLLSVASLASLARVFSADLSTLWLNLNKIYASLTFLQFPFYFFVQWTRHIKVHIKTRKKVNTNILVEQREETKTKGNHEQEH